MGGGKWQAKEGGVVLIVEDDQVVARTIARLLPTDHRVHVASTRAEAVRAVQELDELHVALVDLTLGRDVTAGLRVLRLLAARRPTVARVVISASTDPKRINDVLLTGASYVAKPFAAAQVSYVMSRADRARRARAALSTVIADRSMAYGLTKRQREIVSLLVDGATRARVAEDLVITPKTLRRHVQRILSRAHVYPSMGDLVQSILREALAAAMQAS